MVSLPFKWPLFPIVHSVQSHTYLWVRDGTPRERRFAFVLFWQETCTLRFRPSLHNVISTIAGYTRHLALAVSSLSANYDHVENTHCKKRLGAHAQYKTLWYTRNNNVIRHIYAHSVEIILAVRRTKLDNGYACCNDDVYATGAVHKTIDIVVRTIVRFFFLLLSVHPQEHCERCS